MSNKRVIHANVSEEAFQSWQEFSIEHGVSVTGIIEALGTMGPLVNGRAVSSTDLIKEARQVDSERRRRGGRRS